jgi:hypothetical protein
MNAQHGGGNMSFVHSTHVTTTTNNKYITSREINGIFHHQEVKQHDPTLAHDILT